MTFTLKDYWKGRDLSYDKELTPEIRTNAAHLLSRVNALMVSAPVGIVPTQISSGWRPSAINANVKGAARRSRHLTGQAVDLADPKGLFGAWCLANLKQLEIIGLWLEHPSATKTWVHLQTTAPASRNRVFYP